MQNRIYPSLKNGAALVTGGINGLGKALSQKLLENEMTLFVADVDKKNGLELEADYRSRGFNYHFIETDLSDDRSIHELISKVGSKTASLKVLVNNAKPKLDTRPLPHCLESWDFEMKVMLHTPIVLMDAFKKLRINDKLASIINISSTNGDLISDQGLSYHVAKSALNQASRYFANRYAKEKIRVNIVSPGIIEFGPERNSASSEKLNLLTRNTVPIERGGKPYEIANTVAFLASDDSSYITGQNISVDGGFTIGDRFSALNKFINTENEFIRAKR